jgi:hypothetical protein
MSFPNFSFSTRFVGESIFFPKIVNSGKNTAESEKLYRLQTSSKIFLHSGYHVS